MRVSADLRIGEGEEARLAAHPLRAVVLGEVHARPFTPLETPRRVLHFAFETTAERGEADRAALTRFCVERGLPGPEAGSKHHRLTLGATTLRWEQHSEFTTYTWELPNETSGTMPFHPSAPVLGAPMRLVPQPGPLMVAVDLHVIGDGALSVERLFDPTSIAVAETSDGSALFATDFQADPAGFVRILLVDRGLNPARAGALVQRVLEIETYRTFALLGLPEAQRLSPTVRRIEQRLAEVTEEMRRPEGFEANHKLLDELTDLAAELEAGATSTSFRFGASRAYDEIVHLRLQTIGERAVAGFTTWSAFLARRMAPAMRTCSTLEQRLADLATKLARAANLLRTRVDVELQQHNRDLLRSMNRRTQLQLRLQSTVEGLSVAAITYYVVGLFGYVVKGINEAGAPIDPSFSTAAFVPVAVLSIWGVVRRIRRRHIDERIE
jgi:uncharacterized membrane-anchored protein